MCTTTVYLYTFCGCSALHAVAVWFPFCARSGSRTPLRFTFYIALPVACPTARSRLYVTPTRLRSLRSRLLPHVCHCGCLTHGCYARTRLRLVTRYCYTHTRLLDFAALRLCGCPPHRVPVPVPVGYYHTVLVDFGYAFVTPFGCCRVGSVPQRGCCPFALRLLVGYGSALRVACPFHVLVRLRYAFCHCPRGSAAFFITTFGSRTHTRLRILRLRFPTPGSIYAVYPRYLLRLFTTAAGYPAVLLPVLRLVYFTVIYRHAFPVCCHTAACHTHYTCSLLRLRLRLPHGYTHLPAAHLPLRHHI